MNYRKISLLNKSELELLHRGHKHGLKPRFRTRCQMMILLHEKRKTISEVSNLLSIGGDAASICLSRYELEGISGLHDHPKSGRPVKDKDKLLKKI